MTSGPQPGAQASEGMQRLLARAVAEPEFRQLLVESPEQAIASGDFRLNDQERRAITGTPREERAQMMQQLVDAMGQ